MEPQSLNHWTARESEVTQSCPTLCDLRQAPPSMGFSRQEYWSGLPFPSPGNRPNPGIEPRSLTLYTDALHLSHQGSPLQFAHLTFFSIYVYRFIYLFAFWSSVLHELFSSCHQWGQLFAAELGLLIAEHGLWGSWALIVAALGLSGFGF